MLSRHLFSAAITGLVLSLSAPSMAVDINSYLSGQTYLTARVANPNMCESQCSGDAMCKGWNFIRSASTDGSGICEFKSVVSGVSPHPFAISGQARKSGYQSSALVSGQTRTTRIGQPLTVRPQAEVKAQITAQTAPRVYQAAARPVERPKLQPQTQTLTRQRTFAPQASAALAKPATLGGPLHLVRPTAAAASTSTPARASVPQQLSLSEQQERLRRAQGQISTQTPTRAPTLAPTQTPMQAQTGPQGQALQQSAPTPQPTRATAQKEASLYGSLHDNVRTTAPKPLQRSPIPTDLNAPIATAHAAPTASVRESALEMVGGAN